MLIVTAMVRWFFCMLWLFLARLCVLCLCVDGRSGSWLCWSRVGVAYISSDIVRFASVMQLLSVVCYRSEVSGYTNVYRSSWSSGESNKRYCWIQRWIEWWWSRHPEGNRPRLRNGPHGGRISSYIAQQRTWTLQERYGFKAGCTLSMDRYELS